MATPPQDHLACGLSVCLSSSRSAFQAAVFRNLVYELRGGQVSTGSAWKLYICCAAAIPVSGTRVATGLHPGTPNGVLSFFYMVRGTQCTADDSINACFELVSTNDWQVRGLALLHLKAFALCQACGHTDDPSPAHMLAPCLVVLFNAAFSTGQVPQSWKTSLVPQFSSMAPPQTRPTIGQYQWLSQSAGYTPASWYSALSHTQSSSSCGPPPRQGTGQSLAPSILPSPFSMSLTSTGMPASLCTCVSWTSKRPMIRSNGSFSGACYSAWECIGHMLGAVQSLYFGSLLSMKVNGQCGHNQSPSIGLRQGCPLSATLFGIFIDGSHHHLQTTAAGAGVQVRHLQLTDLVYADDICLLAGSPQHLQALIDALVGYCATLHMEISVAKTKVMVVPDLRLGHLL